MQAGASPCCYATRAPGPFVEGRARVANLCFFDGTVSSRFMTTAVMAAAVILLICVRVLCWLPGFLFPDFLRLKYSRLIIYQLRTRASGTLSETILNDQVQIRTTAGIIPSARGRWSLSG